ncbi:MAG: hypothetical protein ACRDY0_09790 [Acidimicrobiales bacterium]
MARATGTTSLANLIEGGALEANEPLVLRRRSKPEVKALLTDVGLLRLGKTDYPTPTTAARAALDGKPTDGWLRWRVPRLDYKTLAEVRDTDV